MGETIELTAADGHSFTAYRAGSGPLGLVVVQEIFGVNGHIRNVVDRFAADGFTAVAPALFDRLGPGHELGYAPSDIEAGRKLRGKVTNEHALADIAAVVAQLAGEGLPVGVVGYCWGGSLAWLSATRLGGIGAAVGYYGGEIARNREERPKAPVMLHFGEEDHGISMKDVDKICRAHPEMEVHTYPAGHGFSCDERGSYDEPSSSLALSRTLPFLRRHLR